MSQAASLRVVLTGGIASGKSTVAALFAALGAPIIDTDVIAREVVAAGTPLLAQVVERFGPGILQSTGELDRAALRKLVFADTQARRDLEALLHPAILREVERLSASAVLIDAVALDVFDMARERAPAAQNRRASRSRPCS